MMVLGISLLGLVVPVFDAPPVFVMIISQAFNVAILPATVACIIYLGNRKDLMGSYRFNMPTNAILLLIMAFSIFTSVIGIKGVLQLLS